MKILHVHCYHVGRGGMEVIYDYTTALLRQRGHEVIELSRDNASLDSPMSKIGALASGIYSVSARREAEQLIAKHQPDLAYVHNLYAMLSTSVLDACHSAGVPVVMNIQDYKLTCPMGQHLRDGKICTKCRDGSVAWCAVHACKGGRLTSLGYSISHGITRMRKAYPKGVDLFVTPAKFVADHLIRAGYDESRIAIVPNMCDLPPQEPRSGDGHYAAFVGRLSPEKGLPVLIEAARLNGIPTKVAGKLPDSEFSKNAPANVSFVGPQTRQALPDFYRQASFLVIPSIWYEVFPIVALEAMTLGIPIIASDIGGLPETFQHERSGLLVPPGDAKALAAAMQRLWNNPQECRRMGDAARKYALGKYSPDAFYRRLMAAFARAIESRRSDVQLASATADKMETFNDHVVSP
jgi:glycosyltransferase involved in cell wall biosynthesis